MKIQRADISGVFLIEPQVFEDERGYFMEAFNQERYSEEGLVGEFVQDNHSGSRQGVLRGLHYQIRQPQGKLVQVITGEVFDVVVDLRRSSATFGEWVGVELSEINRHLLWIPPGFAHGFYTLSEWAVVTYKVTDYYAPEWERTLLWNDPQIGIEWPLLDGRPPILSDKDARGVPLSEAETYP